MKANTEPKTMTLESFAAHYAPAAFPLPERVKSLHGVVMESLPDETQQLITAAQYYYSQNYKVSVQVQCDNADFIISQERAAFWADSMAGYLADIEKAAQEIRALKAYYEQTAAALASTEKVPAYVLSRNKRDYDTHVTYSIARGHFNKTIGKLVIERRKEEEFAGKQHREAHERFAQLVKSTEGCIGFEVNNEYTERVEYEDAVIKA